MSNLIVQNVNGQDTESGKAKAYCNVQGDDISVNDSFNISSVVDVGSGPFWQPNFTNAMANADYSISGGGKVSAGAHPTTSLRQSHAQVAISVRVQTLWQVGSITATDAALPIMVLVHGDLA